MRKVRLTHLTLILALSGLLAFVGVRPASAQSTFIISKNADFSTDDRVFSRDDTLFMRVTAPHIDFTDLDKNEFRLKPDDGGNDIEGRFTNQFDGTYLIAVPLENTDPAEDEWEVRARIRDNAGNEFEAEVEIQIDGEDDLEDEEVVIRGTLEVVSPTLVVVEGTTVLVDADTEVLDADGDPIAVTDLEVGQSVRIVAQRGAAGNLVAKVIRVEDEPREDEIQIKGEIEAIGGDSLVVAGRVFKVNADTEIFDDDGNPITFEELSVGLFVEVRGEAQEDGTFLATRITIEEREDDEEDEEIEINGVIAAIGDSSLLVQGFTIVVTETTVILGDEDEAIAFADLRVGQRVEIRGVKNADGTVEALEIHVEDPAPNEGEMQITGPVVRVGEGSIQVVVFAFAVNESTVILDENGNPISLADIRVGFIVEVKAEVRSDGSLEATRIQIEQRLFDEIEIRGTIRALTDTSITVGGFTFLVNESTVVLDGDDNPIAFSDLEVGQLVEVHAVAQADGSLLATEIKVEDREEDELEITGTIEAIGPDSLVVSGLTFFVDASTVVLDNDENPLAFSDLTVGMIVEVAATLQANGRFLATEIQVEDRFEDEVELTGRIDDLTDSTITVEGRIFVITENTVVLDNDENAITVADLSVGLLVEIRGDLLTDDTLVALRIKIEDSGDVSITGPIDEVRGDAVEVLGLSLAVTGDTEILGKDGNPILLGDLRAGQVAKVTADDNAEVASRIELQEVVILSGAISELKAEGFVLANTEVRVDVGTLILGKLNRALSFEELRVGESVEVRAVRDGDGGGSSSDDLMTATKVKSQESPTPTGIAPEEPEVANVPRAFVLHQNYPNPFNPSTTIGFEIRDAQGPVATRLVIYNVLGQAVRTLVDGPLQAGEHQVRWDGRDDRGQLLPSGVYLYQLQVGDARETRRMILMK